MAKLRVIDFSVYRKRHVLSFVGLIVLLIGLLVAVGLYIPGGVSRSEEQSVVAGSALQWGTLIGKYSSQVVDFPYHLLQRITTEQLGVSVLSIKLPSLMLAFVTIIAFYFVLQLWFRRNIALISAVIATTSGQFLLLAQLGTPRITYVFFGIALLLSASMLTQAQRARSVWFIVTAFIAGLAMYTPLFWYLVGVLVVIALIHPHSRFILMRVEKWALLFGCLIFAVAITPLIFALVKDPGLLATFTGLTTDPSAVSLETLSGLARQYFDFSHTTNTESLTPVYGLGITLLAAIGLYRLFSVKYTAKSYILTAWLLILLPALIFFPSATALTFVPIMLLVAFAFDFLITFWYSMFPLNPYARVAGLVPLAVLLVLLGYANIARFAYTYHYDSAAVSTFSRDVPLLSRTLEREKTTGDIMLVFQPEHKDFYQYYLKTQTNKNISLSTAPLTSTQLATGKTIVTDRQQPAFQTSLIRVVVNDTRDDAARFYIYKSAAK